MANAERGEFALTLAGQPFLFKVGIGAVAHAQELLRTPEHCPGLQEIDRALQQGSLLYLRAVVFGGLRKHHAAVTLDQVDELLERMTENEVRALLRAFGFSITPDAEDLKDLGVTPKSENPPQAQAKARRGPGGRSTSRRAASA
jgi:hypothetical protein